MTPTERNAKLEGIEKRVNYQGGSYMADFRWLCAELREEMRKNAHTERSQQFADGYWGLKALLAEKDSEITRLKEEGQRDYDGMRDMQRKFIAASQEITRLREALIVQGCACRPGVPSEGESPYQCVRCAALGKEKSNAG